MNSSDLYLMTVCDTIYEKLIELEKKAYSTHIFNILMRSVYLTQIKKYEQDYNNSILKLEEYLKQDYNI